MRAKKTILLVVTDSLTLQIQAHRSLVMKCRLLTHLTDGKPFAGDEQSDLMPGKLGIYNNSDLEAISFQQSRWRLFCLARMLSLFCKAMSICPQINREVCTCTFPFFL
jgi:hypothetical protein